MQIEAEVAGRPPSRLLRSRTSENETCCIEQKLRKRNAQLQQHKGDYIQLTFER